MSSLQDIQCQALIRQVLTGCWVDVAEIHIRVTNGKVYLTGTLQRMTKNLREMQPGQLKFLDLSLRNLRGVRAVKYSFSNWEHNVNGTWQLRITSSTQARKSLAPYRVSVETLERARRTLDALRSAQSTKNARHRE